MRFATGNVFVTLGARDALRKVDAEKLVSRHRNGDWGEICDEDREGNEIAIEKGYPIHSVYTVKGTAIWVITEGDRRITTVLLPEEY